ncbi:hypothetical protein AYI70_g9359 [Smittium culicis]|uniref:Uncharacterized protein n=1 Tax=Smittium culicis TaxID=133412 RepID=A0A1R1XBL2_9FUNG|nr:hypothetical protein AYI70_g9359 [Smittium culicis]
MKLTKKSNGENDSLEKNLQMSQIPQPVPATVAEPESERFQPRPSHPEIQGRSREHHVPKLQVRNHDEDCVQARKQNHRGRRDHHTRFFPAVLGPAHHRYAEG